MNTVLDPIQKLAVDLVQWNSRWSSHFGFRSQDVYCVDRKGQRILFAPPSEIKKNLRDLLFFWHQNFAQTTNKDEIADILTRFWYTFIAIHPFADANGRTVKAFINEQLKTKGLAINSFELLDRFLLEGHVETEIEKLKCLFILSLNNISDGDLL